MSAPPPLPRHNLDWNLLKIFHEIVEAGGISQSAARLGRKQPAVSLALKRLEERVGAVLCRRGPAGFELSDEGAHVAEICDELSRLVGLISSRVAGASPELRGRVRVQLISSIVNEAFDETIRRFHEQHPDVELVFNVSTWDAIGRLLLRNEIDIGIAPARFHHAELRYDLLFREVHRPYCGPSHPLFGRAALEVRELSAYPFILTGADEPDELTNYRHQHGLGRKVAGVSEHLDEAKRLTVLGVGIGFLPVAFAERDVAEGRLWPLTTSSSEPAMEIYVITNPSAPRHLAGELFVKALSRHSGITGEEPITILR
jgi:LysR family transcriptional regulator, transcriptional activator for bauABCD operon